MGRNPLVMIIDEDPIFRQELQAMLTPARLAEASGALGLTWHRHRPRYPLAYRVRPWVARLRGRRPPSRFDVWEARFETR